MEWEVEYTDQFAEWWDGLALLEQEALAAVIVNLQRHGAALAFPYSSGVRLSQHPHMRELRVQHRGKPYRILYAFDPRRVAILLIGGDKTGNDRWYEEMVPLADRLYNEHIRTLNDEGLL